VNGAQPGQPAAALRTTAQTWRPAHLQPGLAVPGANPPGTAAPSPAAPTAAGAANPVSRSGIPPGAPVPGSSHVHPASLGASAIGGVPAAAQQLSPGSMAATGTPTATTMPPLSTAAATASQNAGPWSVLYDATGHPAGIANAAGAFSPFPGTDTASASAASPLTLYDSAGQQAGIYNGASRLLPLATAAQSPWLAGIPPAHAAPATQTGTSATPVSPGQQQPVAQVQPTSVPVPDPNQEMQNGTPAQRQQVIRQSLQQALNDPGTTPDQKTAIQQALDGNIADLPDSFYAHGDYTYTDQNGKTTTLSTLAAATTVAMLQAKYSHFGVYIQDLSDTAGKLYAKGDDISLPAMSLGLKFAAADKMWDTIFADIGDSSDPNILQARGNFMQIKNRIFGGLVTDNSATACYSHNTQGSIPSTAQRIRDKANTLYQTAAAYAYMEETNLSLFGLQADDPRPAWEKARFTVTKVNGQLVPVDNSATGKYPPGYFDPNNPGSPFYDGQGPQQ
jgi:hypothetical protein